MLDWTPALVERIRATISDARCIDRAIMPQVAEGDVAELLDFLASRGIGTTTRVVDPRSLAGYQRINKAKVRGMARSMRRNGADMRPILISRDGIIVDGNHRAAAARAVGYVVGAIRIEGDFADVFGHVCEFPKTYESEKV